MIKETVQALAGVNIITESGTKIPLGNREFSVGEIVWTDGQYAFGNERRGGQPVTVDGDGIIGDYFVVQDNTDRWYLYNASNFSHSCIDDNTGISDDLIVFYNKTGTKFCATNDLGLNYPAFQYIEVSSDGIKTHSVDTTSLIVPNGTIYIIDCYYDDDADEPVFKALTYYRSGHDSLGYYGNGNKLSEVSTSSPFYLYTFTGEKLTNSEQILPNLVKDLVKSCADDILESFVQSDIEFTDIIEPTQADIQSYWDSQGSGYSVSDWTVVWQDSLDKDDDRSTVNAYCYNSENKLNYPDNQAQQDIVRGYLAYIKPKSETGYGAIVLDSDYANTIDALGFDDGTLDNYYVITYASSGKSYSISKYGANVVVPDESSLPTGYSLVSKWTQSSVSLEAYTDTKYYVGESDYAWQDVGSVTKYLYQNTGSTGRLDSFNRHYVMRTAKITYTLMQGATKSYKTVYWTRRCEKLNFSAQAAITKPAMALSQNYHSGWSISYNTETNAVTAEKNGKIYSIGTVDNFKFYVSMVPTLLETNKYVLYYDRRGHKLVKIDRDTLKKTEVLSGVYHVMQETNVIWRVPYAQLLYLLSQSAT